MEKTIMNWNLFILYIMLLLSESWNGTDHNFIFWTNKCKRKRARCTRKKFMWSSLSV